MHSHQKRNDSQETRAVLLIFSIELDISGMAVQSIDQNSKKWWLCEELLSENDFKTVLSTFCCYDYGANTSKTVRKIATDQKDYHKCSSCVIVCWIAKTNKSITVKKRLVTRILPTYLKKLQKLHRKSSNNWSMVTFIHNESEITTWMGYSFKTKSAKSKATSLRYKHLYLNLKLQIIRSAQGHWSCTPAH